MSEGQKEYSIEKAAIVGLGALGAAYIRQIVQYHSGVKVSGYVREPERYMEDPVTINGEELDVTYECLGPEAEPADLVIVAVKSYDLEAVLPSLAPLVGRDTVILSLLNGVKSEEQIAGLYGKEHVLWSVVMGADLNRAGHKICLNKIGELHFGEKYNLVPSKRVRRVKEFFDICKIPCVVPEDMERVMWKKLLINVGMNQVSTVLEYTYEQVRNSPQAMQMMREAQREVISVAQKKGIRMSEADIEDWEIQLAGLSDNGRSSMLQDYWEKRKLECDILGRFICEAGDKCGVDTPVNRVLWQQIREKEIKQQEME